VGGAAEGDPWCQGKKKTDPWGDQQEHSGWLSRVSHRKLSVAHGLDAVSMMRLLGEILSFLLVHSGGGKKLFQTAGYLLVSPDSGLPRSRMSCFPRAGNKKTLRSDARWFIRADMAIPAFVHVGSHTFFSLSIDGTCLVDST
jgi:hypothetical protein